ncbi:hypothetical protein CPAV1605_598 [seawater metagenome]|uniref:Packaging ATPase n=1 Tax=seawater metagenome TaxID=1561972 RepID=A0A5E8CHN2_9ZZZZ
MTSKTKSINYGASRLQLKKFDLTKMVDHATIAMIAKRGSGKSWVCRNIMFAKKDIATSVVISPTEKLNSFYGNFIPPIYIYNRYDGDVLSRIYNRQEMMMEDNKKRVEKGKKTKDDRILLIMDDCMSSKGKWLKDDQILELFFNGRHHHVSFILTMQFSLGIPPELRSNFDYIFLLGEDFISNRKRLYEHYAGMFPTFDIFQQVFNEVTADYGCMVINNKIHSKKLEEKVFWFKATPVPDFDIGNRFYREFNKKNFDKEHGKRLPLFDPNMALANKRNAVNLVIEKI